MLKPGMGAQAAAQISHGVLSGAPGGAYQGGVRAEKGAQELAPPSFSPLTVLCRKTMHISGLRRSLEFAPLNNLLCSADHIVLHD